MKNLSHTVSCHALPFLISALYSHSIRLYYSFVHQNSWYQGKCPPNVKFHMLLQQPRHWEVAWAAMTELHTARRDTPHLYRANPHIHSRFWHSLLGKFSVCHMVSSMDYFCMCIIFFCGLLISAFNFLFFINFSFIHL